MYCTQVTLCFVLCCIQAVTPDLVWCTRQDSPSSVSFIACYTGCCGRNYTTHCCNTTTIATLGTTTVPSIHPLPLKILNTWAITGIVVGCVVFVVVVVGIVLCCVCCNRAAEPSPHSQKDNVIQQNIYPDMSVVKHQVTINDGYREKVYPSKV